MDESYDRAQQLKTEKALAKREIQGKLNFTEQQLLLLTEEMKEKICHMVEDVEQRVSHISNHFHRSLSDWVCHILYFFTGFCEPSGSIKGRECLNCLSS
jgi:mitofusin